MNDDRAVALYWDFENLHASLCEAQQEGSYGRQDNKYDGLHYELSCESICISGFPASL